MKYDDMRTPPVPPRKRSLIGDEALRQTNRAYGRPAPGSPVMPPHTVRLVCSLVLAVLVAAAVGGWLGIAAAVLAFVALLTLDGLA